MNRINCPELQSVYKWKKKQAGGPLTGGWQDYSPVSQKSSLLYMAPHHLQPPVPGLMPCRCLVCQESRG